MTDTAYTIREATTRDAEAIMSVHVRAILELGASAYTRAEVESWAAGLRPEGYARVMAAGLEQFEVAVNDEGLIVGFCSVTENEIKALYVDPDWARRGIASTLVTRAEERIGTAGHRSVIIGAALSGLPFYLARGYAIEVRDEWETRGGLVLKATTLRKHL